MTHSRRATFTAAAAGMFALSVLAARPASSQAGDPFRSVRNPSTVVSSSGR